MAQHSTTRFIAQPPTMAIGTGHAARATDQGRLAQAMSALMGAPVAQSGVDVALSAITASALIVIPSAAYAGITCPAQQGSRRSYGSTDILVDTLDLLQETFRQGPCVDPRAATVTTISDVATETRWPRFTAAAGRLGVGSMLVRAIASDGDVRGMLALYATSPGAFSVDDEVLAAVLAGDAAVVLAAVDPPGHVQPRRWNHDHR